MNAFERRERGKKMHVGVGDRGRVERDDLAGFAGAVDVDAELEFLQGPLQRCGLRIGYRLGGFRRCDRWRCRLHLHRFRRFSQTFDELLLLALPRFVAVPFGFELGAIGDALDRGDGNGAELVGCGEITSGDPSADLVRQQG